METAIIEVQDLEVGDEILIPSGSTFKYYRVLKTASKSKKSYRYNSSKERYTSVRISTNVIEKPYTRTCGGKVYNYINKKYICTPNNHNKVMSVDLNFKQILLMNR